MQSRTCSLSVVVFVGLQTIVTAAWAAEPSRDDTLRQELNEPVEFSFAGTPLTDVIKTLQKKYSLEIEIDRKHIDDAEGVLKSPISFRAAGISLGQALRRIMADLGLGLMTRDAALVITTQEIAAQQAVTRYYPVLDLTRRPDGDELYRPREPYQELSELLRTSIDPDSWVATLDGTPTHNFGQNKGRLPVPHVVRAGVLVVPQTPQNHQRIATLLELIRRVRDQQFALSKLKTLAERSFQPQKMPDDVDPALRRALASKIDLDLKNVSLQKAVETIAEQAAEPVYLDRHALADANVSLDEPLTLQVQATPLQTSLNLLLHPHNLGWKIEDQLLLVTTRNLARAEKTTQVYPVADLLDVSLDEDWHDLPAAQTRVLQSLLTLVDDGSMAEKNKRFVYLASAAALVVTQTDEQHLQFESLLTSLRDARAKQFPTQTGQPDRDDKTLRVRLYRLPARNSPQNSSGGFGRSTEPQLIQFYPADDLAKIVPQLVEPGSWKGAGGEGTIQALGERLAVRQTEKVHRQIVRLFVTLQAAE